MSVCPECGNTGLRPVEQGRAGATHTVLGRCKCQVPTVTIPRAEYEALMAAAKSLAAFRSRHPAVSALRALGIDPSEDKAT
jgi:hypothetical protein